MANPWFRMYAEFATDPKVQMLSEADQRRLTMLLCLRCNDHVTLQDSEVTFLLRISNDEWQITKALFMERGFIDNNNSIRNWDKRQFKSDTSKNRVAAYRERKSLASNDDVTLQKQKSNAIDTEQIQNRTDTEHALACPYDELVNLFHACLPNNPKCKVLNNSRKGLIKQRWNEAAKLLCKPFGYKTIAEGLTAWEEFFLICASSDFLTGKVKPRDGQKTFFATVDFIFSPSGFAKTLENNYHRE